MKSSVAVFSQRTLALLLAIPLTLLSLSPVSAQDDFQQSRVNPAITFTPIPIPFPIYLPLVSCPRDTSTSGGDLIDRGFYVDDWPGYSISTVYLHFKPTVAGTYTYQLTARRSTYDGEVIGVAATSVVYANNTDFVQVPFYFGDVLAYHGERVTFKMEEISGSGDTYFSLYSTNASCPVVETNGTEAPISSFRRNGIAVSIYGDTAAASPVGSLENPQPASYHGGIGLVSGWVCSASKVEIQFDSYPRMLAAYGTSRMDTQSICGDSDNGFGLLYNFNLLGNGAHTVKLFADNVQIASTAFTVTTLGAEFRTGLSGTYSLSGFPQTGQSVGVEWAQSLQNFVIRSFAP